MENDRVPRDLYVLFRLSEKASTGKGTNQSAVLQIFPKDKVNIINHNQRISTNDPVYIRGFILVKYDDYVFHKLDLHYDGKHLFAMPIMSYKAPLKHVSGQDYVAEFPIQRYSLRLVLEVDGKIQLSSSTHM